MLQSSTIKFIKDLKKNNTKEWFDANRKMYEAAKQDFLSLTETILKGIAAKDETLSQLEPKKCVFRINRDVRFSKDKSPYKTNMGMSISKGGKSAMSAGYYFHLEPGACFIGGGIYMPMPDEVKKIRQEIDYNWDEFKKIITNKKFVETFGDISKGAEFSLSRPPKGYDENNPAIDYLKLKSWTISTTIKDEELTDKNIAKKIVTTFETIKPLIDFLNRGIDN
ncbi:MAG: DUF2461 domain-containing protein [Chitinophagaceae bacterium]